MVVIGCDNASDDETTAPPTAADILANYCQFPGQVALNPVSPIISGNSFTVTTTIDPTADSSIVCTVKIRFRNYDVANANTFMYWACSGSSAYSLNQITLGPAGDNINFSLSIAVEPAGTNNAAGTYYLSDVEITHKQCQSLLRNGRPRK